MTPTEFKALKPGDLIIDKCSGGIYTVRCNGYKGDEEGTGFLSADPGLTTRDPSAWVLATRPVPVHAGPDFYLSFGDRFPYDAGEDFWHGSDPADTTPPPPIDWAHRAARGIMADLDDRKGISGSFQRVDHETRADMVRSLTEIIRTAARAAAGDVK